MNINEYVFLIFIVLDHPRGVIIVIAPETWSPAAYIYIPNLVWFGVPKVLSRSNCI